MILVTGATGLIGSHLTLELLRQGKEVVATKRENSNLDVLKRVISHYSDDTEGLFSKIHWREGDLLDATFLEDLLKEVSEVYHCAGMVSFDPRDRGKMKNTNVTVTTNLVNLALELETKKFCHVSSVSALGSLAGGGEITEKAIWKSSKSKTYYALTKFRSEMEVWRGIEEGLNAVIVNPGVVLGPGKWDQGSLQLFHRVEKGLRYYTEGVTSFVDVRDVSRAMTMLMEKGIWGERFILHSENLSYKEVLSLIAIGLNKRPPVKRVSPLLMESLWRLEKIRSGLAGSPPVITKESARAGRTQKCFSNKKITGALGIKFRPMRESIKEICGMYLSEQQINT